LSSVDEILDHYAADRLPQLFVRRTRGLRNDEVRTLFYSDLINLHNSGLIDVLETARRIEQSPISQTDFFNVQQVYVDIIPELEDEIAAMIQAVQALVARGANDLAAGRPNGAFRIWAEKRGRARAILDEIQPTDLKNAAYLFLALLALAKDEAEAALTQAINFLASQNLSAQLGGAKAIGNMQLATTEERKRALDALEAALTAGAEDNLVANILTSAVEIVRKGKSEEERAIRLIDSMCLNAGDQTIHSAISTLMFQEGDLSTAVVASLTRIARKVRLQNTGSIDYLNAAASKLVRQNRINEALEIIAPVIVANRELSSFDQLDSFAYSLLNLEDERLGLIIIGWLLSLDRALGEAARGLVGKHHGGFLVLEFDPASLNLSDNQLIVAAHRAIGFLFMYPVTAASLVLSLLDVASDKGRLVIEEILFEPLLINFSGELSDWMRAKTSLSSSAQVVIIERLLARLDEYLDGLHKVGNISEFRPSERERLIENHRQQESMRQTHKEAQKKSILMSIVSRSVLLYGSQSVSYVSDPNGKKQRREMKLKTYKHSIEAPRLDILEPFDLDYTLRLFRAMKVAP
jgi:hypothetical protein